MTWGLVLTVLLYGGILFPDCILAVGLTGLTYGGLIELREWDLRKAVKSGDSWRIRRIMESDWTLKILYTYLKK